MISNANILVAALDWGNGHATRTTALISQLLAKENVVEIAASPCQANYWKETFPLLTLHVILPDNHIRWGKHAAAKLLFRFSELRKNWKLEEEAIAELCSKNPYDVIISDNRYGVRHASVKSILLTHQLSLPLNGISKLVGNWLVAKLANRFHEIWIPDQASQPRLSGNLNESAGIIRPVKYIGTLHPPKPEKESDNQAVLVMLSGPEPQRSVFAKQCAQVLTEMKETFVIMGSCEQKIESEFATILGQVSVEAAMQRQANHRRIICRSGYTTLMELHANNRKALLIPTPGQAEQEYLADHWNKSFGYPSCTEKTLNKTNLELLLKQL